MTFTMYNIWRVSHHKQYLAFRIDYITIYKKSLRQKKLRITVQDWPSHIINCDLQGRKIHFSNSKTLVSRPTVNARDAARSLETQAKKKKERNANGKKRRNMKKKDASKKQTKKTQVQKKNSKKNDKNEKKKKKKKKKGENKT